MLVRVRTGQIVGTAWREPGDVVEIPDDRARHLIREGHAEESPAPPPPAPRPKPEKRRKP